MSQMKMCLVFFARLTMNTDLSRNLYHIYCLVENLYILAQTEDSDYEKDCWIFFENLPLENDFILLRTQQFSMNASEYLSAFLKHDIVKKNLAENLCSCKLCLCNTSYDYCDTLNEIPTTLESIRVELVNEVRQNKNQLHGLYLRRLLRYINNLQKDWIILNH